MKTDIIVIGAGPVGLFTVFEAGILGLNCTLIDNLDKPGGQCAELYPEKPIFDIPGVPYQTGQEHVDALLEQIKPFDYKLHLNQRVEQIEQKNNGWLVTTSAGEQFESLNVFIAAGAGAFEPIKPNINTDISQLEDKQVHYSVKDKLSYEGKKVLVFGGGDSALDWTIYLAEIAEEVSLVHRRTSFRGHLDSVDKVMALAKAGRINLITNAEVKEVSGNETLDSVSVHAKDGSTKNIECDHWLPLFGLTPTLGPIGDWGLTIEKNSIVVDNASDYQTNIEGIYAIGDVNTYPGKLKLILCGFHEGTIMVQSAFKRAYPDKKLSFKYTTVMGGVEIGRAHV